MSQPKTRCFVSYCQTDTDRNDLDYLVNLLEKNSKQKYEILIDVKLDPGANISEFMELLNTVDAVIVVMSPEYKRRALYKQGGVYQEYKLICNRYDKLQEQKKQGKKTGDIQGYFDLIPLLFSGTQETSVPDELKNLLYLDFVGFRTTSKEAATEAIKRKYLPAIKRIADKLQLVTTLKNRSFKQLYDEYFSRLFLETKADWKNPRDKEYNYVDTLFVKTLAYRKIQSHSVFFMIGRKGSGKSTVADIISITQRERYKDIIRVNADEFNLEQLYVFFDDEKIRSDMRNVFRRLTCFQFSWEAFLYCCCMEILVAKEKSGGLASHQSTYIPPLLSFLQALKGSMDGIDTQNDKSPFFIYSFNAVSRFMEECIKQARTDAAYFHSDIALQFTLPRFLKYTFGEEVIQSFYSIMNTCSKGFLITLDGFDTAFDMFRRDSIIKYKDDDVTVRAIFEIDWLRAFLLLVLDIKEKRRGSNRLYDFMEFCITVPKDRFLELLRTERDSYRYTHRYCSLNWSGIELAILLWKRLEELGQHATRKIDSPEERLADVLKEKFAHIPAEISFIFNEKQYTMPLFMYVLRHTFWRPRDILLYYAKIVSAAESMRRRGLRISTEAIRRTVQDTTYEVIKSEFINELITTVINIVEIIEGFYSCPQVLPYDKVADILANKDFKYASGVDASKDINDKIDFLYQIGFLGLSVSPEMCRRLKMTSSEAFYFNAGLLPLRTAMQEKFKSFRFIIHPIFCEYLQLNTSNQELTLQFRWDQLHDMEDLLFASGTVFLAF